MKKEDLKIGTELYAIIKNLMYKDSRYEIVKFHIADIENDNTNSHGTLYCISVGKLKANEAKGKNIVLSPISIDKEFSEKLVKFEFYTTVADAIYELDIELDNDIARTINQLSNLNQERRFNKYVAIESINTYVDYLAHCERQCDAPLMYDNTKGVNLCHRL